MVPAPGGLDDRLNVGILGLPVELLLRSRAVGNKLRGIARAALAKDGRNRVPGHATAGVNHFLHAPPLPRAQVELQTFPVAQLLERLEMGRAKIIDMNVIADTGAIGRGIVVAKDGDLLPLPECHLEDDRNEVRLGRVVFAQIAIGARAGGVEISLAALVPKPRVNLTRFHGVFAPNSKHRALVTPAKRGKGSKSKGAAVQDEKTPVQRHAAMTWAQRLKRVFNIDVETCRVCGGTAKVIACIEDPVVIKKILTYMEDKLSARVAPLLPDSRAPPQSSLFG